MTMDDDMYPGRPECGREWVGDERRNLAALLSALDAPEHADPVEWARALRELLEIACNYDELVLSRRVIEHIEARVWPLRTPPRPLPDGPGQWWGRLPGGTYRAVDVVHCDGLVARPAWAVNDLPLDGLMWLAGPDGKAVRCEPPEVDRG